MRVHGVTAGPLFPDEGPRGPRLTRRVRGITIELVAFVLVTLYDWRIHWMRGHIGGIRVLFGVGFEVEDIEQAGPGRAPWSCSCAMPA